MTRTSRPAKSSLQPTESGDQALGTIVADFTTLLDFVGTEGLRTSGKYHQLPLDCLSKLDQLMSRPLNLTLRRPQLKSYPNLMALYLLFRGLGLAQCSGDEKRGGRIAVDAEIRARWDALNPTEKYCNLLEAWFRLASFEVIGQRRHLHHKIRDILFTLGHAKQAAARVRTYDIEGRCQLELLQFFGIAEYERPLSFGDLEHSCEVHMTDAGRQLRPLLLEACRDCELLSEDLDPVLGRFQEMLRHLFPAWRRNLEYPERQFRDGVYEFKVALGQVWRLIAIPATCELDYFADFILQAFRFDNDHLYQFTVKDRRGMDVHIVHPNCSTGISAEEFAIGCLPLREGESMEFLFDFGDEWEFQVTLENIQPANRRMKNAKLLKKHGQAPKQYDFDYW